MDSQSQTAYPKYTDRTIDSLTALATKHRHENAINPILTLHYTYECGLTLVLVHPHVGCEVSSCSASLATDITDNKTKWLEGSAFELIIIITIIPISTFLQQLLSLHLPLFRPVSPNFPIAKKTIGNSCSQYSMARCQQVTQPMVYKPQRQSTLIKATNNLRLSVTESGN